jgi:predicted acetyltransferase
MNVELVPCIKDRDFFIYLAQEYVKELQKYDDRIIWDEATWDRGIWDSLFIVDGGILCGFLCKKEIEFKNKPPLLFIDEFFISEDERRRRVGMEAVRRLVRDWRGDVGLYILDRNDGAKGFWKAVEKELKWVPVDRKEIREEEGCEPRVFRV